MWLSLITVSLLSRHVWCRASTGEVFVARRRRLATGAAQLRSDTVSATSEADASARRAKPRANKMAKTGRNAVVSAVFSLRGGALNCRRCSLRECCLLEGQPASGPKRLATTRHWVPHGLRRRLYEQKPRHHAQGAQKYRQAPGRRQNPSLQRNETPPMRGGGPGGRRARPGSSLTIWCKTASNVRPCFRGTAEGVNSCKRRSDNTRNKPQQRCGRRLSWVRCSP